MQRDLWKELCSYDNLELAYKKARKHKTTKNYVINFEKDLQNNLLLLRSELLLHSYRPKPLVNFIVRDPKTRKISKSNFRDRVIHHALCNIIEPIYEKSFIFDSCANRKGKGALKALQRFDCFKRKVSRNNTIKCYALKADIKKYFETIDHEVLMKTIKKKISDNKVLWLIRKILNNCAGGGRSTQGMPLGNLTSQFFANVFLNELDQFVKHKLKAKFYIRYVDDFVILHRNKETLETYKEKIKDFLKTLKLELHPDKSKIISLNNGVAMLGYRVFYHYKLLRKSNLRKSYRNISEKIKLVEDNVLPYDSLLDALNGWFGYAMWANTCKLRKNLMKEIDELFCNRIADKDIDRWLNVIK
jgi:RNA-directed DNA polymerase